MGRRDLSRVKERDALRPSVKADPYWQRLSPGCFLGYCPAAKGGSGTWVARAYDSEARRYRREALGAFSDIPASARFGIAKLAAERFAEMVAAGGHTETAIETVGDACRNFALDRPEVEARFTRYVYSEPIAKIGLTQLRRRHLKSWREALAARPALISRAKAGEQRTRKRSASTVNRDVAVLRAALGRVLPPGRPNSEAAWQEALSPTANATGRRTSYLDRDERRALLDRITIEAVPFFTALCLLPLRPGAVASLDVGDFDQRTSELSVGKDKAGSDRRLKVPVATAKHLLAQLKGRSSDDPMFVRANGRRWDKNSWKLPIADAAKSAGLASGVTAYTLRHSTITDLVTAGLPLLTIAQISGTSAEMIERHYGHLSNSAAVAALSTLEF